MKICRIFLWAKREPKHHNSKMIENSQKKRTANPMELQPLMKEKPRTRNDNNLFPRREERHLKERKEPNKDIIPMPKSRYDLSKAIE